MTAPTLTAEPLSTVRSESVRWLWRSYIPRGKLAILDGDPGVGKSLLTLDLAARLSRGGSLPDGSPSGRAHVTLLLSAEDSVIDTLRPRAEAAGADLDRLLAISIPDGDRVQFPDDIAKLETLICARQADLVVIDPVMAFLSPAFASNIDQCVRGVLNALARLAERRDCTILLVRHLRKQPAVRAVHRGLGSVGIIGAMRAGLLAAAHPADPELRVLAVTKTNLGRTPPALGFRLRGDDPATVAIEWTGTLDLAADALGLAVPSLWPRDRAADWLHQELANGPRKAAELFALAAEAGIPERTLARAKAEVHVRSQLVSAAGGERIWYWYDPGAAWPSDAPFKKSRELPPLDDL